MPELFGTVVVRGRFFPHCGVVRLDTPHEGRSLAVLNMETKGRSSLPFDGGNLTIGTAVVITEFEVVSGGGILALNVAVRRDGYAVGQRPPGLRDDGSFETPLGVRAHSIVGAGGEVLTVNKSTGLLMGDKEAEDEFLLDLHRSMRR